MGEESDLGEIGSEEFEEDDDFESEQDETARREDARKRVEAMGLIERLIYWSNPKDTVNIAYELSDEKLGEIGMIVVEETAIDEKSREDWWDAAKEGRDMALQRTEAKNYPWPDCSNVIFPLITSAADQFAARAYPAIIKDRNVVKGVVQGDDNGEKAPAAAPGGDMMAAMMGHNGGPAAEEWLVPPGAKAARAKRIGDHMSYQMLEEMPEWEDDTDKLLNILPIEGCVFRKTYRDFADARNVSTMVQAEHLIINYWAKSLETAPRVTEVLRLYPNEVQEHINSGFFLNENYGPDNAAANDKDHPLEFLEQHRRLDLDDDGYTEPYVVTVHRDSMRVARIVARWDATDGGIKRVPGSTDKVAKITPVHYYTKYDFLPNKEGGIYGFGFAHVLRTLNEAVNSTLNMLLDAGTMSNTGGGFIGKGLGMMSGDVTFGPNEWKVVNSVGQDISRSIVPLPRNEPSPVLFQLLGMLIDAGKDISSVKDVLTGDVRAQTMSPTVFMALVEQGLKVFTAIYKRVFRGLKSEFRKVYRLNRIYMDEVAEYQVGDQWSTVSRADYQAGTAVVPVSDPTMVVDAQKMARAQVLAEFKDDPLLNGKEIRKRLLEAAGIENPDDILKSDPAPNPEMIARVAELEIKALAAKADVLVKISQAIKNMADADAKVMEPFQQWAALQLQQVKNEYEHLAASNEAQGAATGAAGNPGTDPGNMGPMAPAPGNEGAPPLPPGLSSAVA
jgi:chaperonin GroES